MINILFNVILTLMAFFVVYILYVGCKPLHLKQMYYGVKKLLLCHRCRGQKSKDCSVSRTGDHETAYAQQQAPLTALTNASSHYRQLLFLSPPAPKTSTTSSSNNSSFLLEEEQLL